MSNSDKEFEEWWGKSLTGIKIYPNNGFVAKQAWNHLYPYKERSLLAEARLEAECIRHKDTEEQLNVSKAQIKEKEDVIKSLESKVKELEKENNNLKFNIIEYMKNETLKLEAKVKELEGGQNMLGKRISDLLDENEDLEAKVRELEVKLGEKTQALTYANSCIGLRNEKVQALEAEVRKLEKYRELYLQCRDAIKKNREIKAQLEDYESGHRGACFTCEPVGELNKKLEALLIEAFNRLTCDFYHGAGLGNRYHRDDCIKCKLEPEVKKIRGKE